MILNIHEMTSILVSIMFSTFYINNVNSSFTVLLSPQIDVAAQK